MRHIAIETFIPSPEWLQRSDAATLDLSQKTTRDERLAYIKSHSAIWKDFGKELVAHFGNKCWYTDASNYGARLDVEHFRPKAKTIELSESDYEEASSDLLLKHLDPPRTGYWWLAFDSENLLLCAQVMNREDKKNFFPLHRDSPVGTEEKKQVWRNEIPVFLDPRRIDDVCLVVYDESGGMRPRADLSVWDALRVTITNDCFGLSRFQPLVEGRQRIWQKCSDLMGRYISASARQLRDGTPNPILQQEKNDALLELKGLLDPNEQFSTVAASYLQNSPHPWAKVLASQPFNIHT